MKNTINSIKVELEMAKVEAKITALAEDREFKAQETIRRVKRGDVNAIAWNGKKIQDLNHEIDNLLHYVRGMQAASRIIKESN